MVEHDFDVMQQHAHHGSPRKRELLQKELDYLLAHGLAEPSFSVWSSPCLLVNKQDGTYHF